MNIQSLKHKRILFTGGLGFIGKSFVRSLLDDNIDVVVLDKAARNTNDKTTQDFQIIRGDVTLEQTWKRLPKCEFLFHFAAPSSVILFHENLNECVNTTVKGFVHALNWANKTCVEKVIYPSSGSIFGENSGACSEETPPFPLNTYGQTKFACEHIARVYANVVPTLGLRIFAGYGPQENHKGNIASVITLFLNKILLKKSPVIYGNGKQTRDFVYIDDIVDALYASMDPHITGVLNIGSGESVSFNDVIRTINILLHTNIKPTYIQKPQHYLQHTKCDPSRIEHLLHHPMIPLKKGLSRYLKELKVIS